MKNVAKRLTQALVATVLIALALAVAGFVGLRVSTSESRLPVADTGPHDELRRPPVRSGTLRVAVVLGSSGTVATDAMGPYEVFASSPRFSVYTVAATHGAAAVDGAPSILPAYTFDEVDSSLRLTPDVVVVPAMKDPEGEGEAIVRGWIRAQADRGAQVLAVCTGARVVAAAGLLDGRTATSHWSQLAGLRRNHPETTWVDGTRYVRDGRVTTTAGISSGIVGALAVIDELFGPQEAARVGAPLGYPGWSVDGSTQIPVQSFSLGDRPVALNALLPWFRPTLAVVLVDGVSEIDAAAAFEVYNSSFAARIVAVSRTGFTRTRHGLVLVGVPEDAVRRVDRVVEPGVTTTDALDGGTSAWAVELGVDFDPMTGPSGRTGFDGALEYLGHHTTRATAVSAAKMVDYPVAELDLGPGRFESRTTGLAAAVLAGALSVIASPLLVRRRRRQALAQVQLRQLPS